MTKKKSGPNWKAINEALRKDPAVREKLQELVNEGANEVMLSIDMEEHGYFINNTEGIVIDNPRKRPAGIVRIGGGYAPGRLTARQLEEKHNYLTSVMTSLMADNNLKPKKGR